MTDASCVLDRVDTSNPDACWLWPGATNGRKGYPVLRVAGHYAMAHRLVYEAVFGEIPSGLTLDHVCHTMDVACPGGACDHRRCVNPAHLEPVTRGENARRGGNARKTHCSNGHSFEEHGYKLKTRNAGAASASAPGVNAIGREE